MTAYEAGTMDKQIDQDNRHSVGETPDDIDRSTRTSCRSYKEAKYLAASRRRTGDDRNAYAVFESALALWRV